MECCFSTRMERAMGERQKGTPRAAWKLHPLFLPSKPAGCRCQSGIKTSKLGNGKPTNGNVTLQNHNGQAPECLRTATAHHTEVRHGLRILFPLWDYFLKLAKSEHPPSAAQSSFLPLPSRTGQVSQVYGQVQRPC